MPMQLCMAQCFCKAGEINQSCFGLKSANHVKCYNFPPLSLWLDSRAFVGDLLANIILIFPPSKFGQHDIAHYCLCNENPDNSNVIYNAEMNVGGQIENF